jgi:hypothetical protein
VKKLIIWLIVIVVLVVAGLWVWQKVREEKQILLHGESGEPGKVKDEAGQAGRTAESFPGADEDYYADMDYGVSKNPDLVYARLKPFLAENATKEEALRNFVIGRNNWIVWTAGNDRLWDILSVRSVGNLDLLKTVSNHPSLKFSRDNRWSYLGLVNEPCYKKGAAPRPARWGLYLDTRDPACGPDPFENEQKYPGVKFGARGDGKLAVGSYYGYGTGIVGLRLFPNPNFDAKAQAAWDPERYYNDPKYYNNEKLVKPYRVGMSCGFCHVGPNPSNPPADFENPKWENLNSNPGAQYFWIDRIFMWNADESSFIYQFFHTSRPGALDTSLVSSDQINNPRTMNAVYNLPARLDIAGKWGTEKLAGGSLDNAQFNTVKGLSQAVNAYFVPPDTVKTPHVLKDGADSVGALGALNRVYINIGLFSEEWLLHFIPLLGGTHKHPITPITIKSLNENSVMWNANLAQTPPLALFFLGSATPDYLAAAPGGAKHLGDANLIPRGKVVFAERCARCHSSKQPDYVFQNYFKPGCIGKDYLNCWNQYWQHTKTPQYKQAMTQIVNDPKFLEQNFLSTELRVPVTLLQTQACSPLATNAIAGDTWDNFSSQSYKELPAVGQVLVHHPYTGATSWFNMPGNGRGYTRPASLVSVWSTAPFLLNNSLGPFRYEGTVDARMDSFNRSIEQLLWPERREGDRSYQTVSGKSHPGIIDKTKGSTYLYVASGYLPQNELLTELAKKAIPSAVQPDGLRIGPIPDGTPINMITNIDLQHAPLTKLTDLFITLFGDLHKLPKNATDEEARKIFANSVPKFLAVSKCPDFVVNRGHYFGTDFMPPGENEPGLSDADKRALIAFVKTF